MVYDQGAGSFDLSFQNQEIVLQMQGPEQTYVLPLICSVNTLVYETSFLRHK